MDEYQKRVSANKRGTALGNRNPGIIKGGFRSGVSNKQTNAKQAIANARAYEPRPSQLEQSAQWAKNVSKSLGNARDAFITGIPDFAKSLSDPVVGIGQNVADTVTGKLYQDIAIEQRRNNDEADRIKMISQRYKSGKMSKQRYKELLLESRDVSQESSKRLAETAARADMGNVVENAALTALTILSAGSYAPIRGVVGGSKALKGTTLTSKALFGKGGANLVRIEQAAARIPSVKELLARNGAKFANRSGFADGAIKDAAVGALIKQPFIYHQNVDDISKIYKDLDDENIAGALGTMAWISTQAISGGMFGAAIEKTKSAGKGLKQLATGKGSLIDEISTRLSGGDSAGIKKYLDELATKDPKKFKEVERAMRAFQEANLNRWGDARRATENIRSYIDLNFSKAMNTMTPEEFVESNYSIWKYTEQVNALAKTGKIKTVNDVAVNPGTIAVGRFDRASREALISAMDGMTKEQQLKYLGSLRYDRGVFWAQSDDLYDKIYDIIEKTEDSKSVIRQIKAIDTAQSLKGVPKKLAAQMRKEGLVAIKPKQNLLKVQDFDNMPKLISKYADEGSDYYDPTVDPEPALASVSGALRRAGLSPAAAQETTYNKLKMAVVNELNGTEAAKTLNIKKLKDPTVAGDMILRKLQSYAENLKPLPGSSVNAVTDIRQLSISNVRDALGVSKSTAKEVAQAVLKGYTTLPLEARGLGDRVVDRLFQLPGFRWYNRAQSALRYTYNPFFKLQEVVETGVLTRMQSGNLVWKRNVDELASITKDLDELNIFNTGFSGRGARDDVVLGRLTDNITAVQKLDLAGLADTLARKRGYDSVKDYAVNHYDELEDALKVVVQYPTKGFLNSPMARTLNLAFFPMRYNLKVAGLTAKFVAKQPPAVQYAFIRSTMEAADWLKSDEGLAWQSENAEAIGLMQWLTPTGSVTSIINLLNAPIGGVDSISDLGQLGGIPLGFFTQILEGQGAFENLPAGLQYEVPYVNPKTGEVYDERIPKGVGARFTTALTDFLSASFTYPGRIVGLPGKSQNLNNLSRTLTGQKGSSGYEFKDNTDDLTDLQRRQIEVIKNGLKGPDAERELYRSPNGIGYAIPALEGMIKFGETPTLNERTGLPSSKRTRGGRNTQYPEDKRAERQQRASQLNSSLSQTPEL